MGFESREGRYPGGRFPRKLGMHGDRYPGKVGVPTPFQCCQWSTRYT